MAMNIPTLEELLEAGVHFGHRTSRWHPKMKKYIFTERNGVHIIDLEKTREKIIEVLAQVKAMASEGKHILFISTKPQARALVREKAMECGMPYLIDRWIGGLITNFDEIHKMIRHYISLKEQQASGELEKYLKKEQVQIGKELAKKDVSLEGLTTLTKMPDAIFVPSLQREKTAVTEANRMGVTVIGIADTNANPLNAEYVIPGNDDGVKAVTLLVSLVADAIEEGKKEREKEKETKERMVAVATEGRVVNQE